jgi:hypothetical protein
MALRASERSFPRAPATFDRSAGLIPNIRSEVRVRCAESAKRASCAAVIHEAPAIAASIATFNRNHSR